MYLELYPIGLQRLACKLSGKDCLTCIAYARCIGQQVDTLVTSSDSEASIARRICSFDENFPVPVKSREVKVLSAIFNVCITLCFVLFVLLIKW